METKPIWYGIEANLAWNQGRRMYVAAKPCFAKYNYQENLPFIYLLLNQPQHYENQAKVTRNNNNNNYDNNDNNNKINALTWPRMMEWWSFQSANNDT